MEFQYKKDIIEVGRRLYQKGFVASNDGNISVRINDRQILTTVTGVSKGFLGVEDVVLVDRRGEKISGKGEPSSELKMHLVIYDKRPDVKAVVHAHPPVATGFAVAGIPLAQCILPEVVVSLGAVPVAQYGTPSTVEVCDAILPYVDSAEAFLLANHGAVTLGEDVFRAYYRMETVEHFARILLTARLLGNVNILSREQVEKLVEVRGKMGVKGRFPSCESCGYCGPGSTRAVGADAGNSPGSTPGAPSGAASREPSNLGRSDGPAGQTGSRSACINDKELVELIANVIKEMTKKA
jgi:L-fuculose-phosphate aldolase